MPYDNADTVDLGAGQSWKDGVLTITLQKERKSDAPSGILVRKKPWFDGGPRALKVRLAKGGGTPVEAVATEAKPDAGPNTEPGKLIDAGHGFTLLDAEVDKLPFEFTVGGHTEEGNGVFTVIKYIIFAFLGGLILNVMPCVLPVLSIKAMSIVNSAHKDRKEIFKGSMAYTMGIMASFLVLAILVAIAKSAGRQAGWGDQMQSPVFVIVLFIVIWVFALSLFDMFIIQLPGMQAANKASSKSGHLGSFLSGVFAVLLSTPCTAPLLGSAVGFLFAQSIPIVFVSFMAIGLGLAFPFILLGLTPKAVKWIPKPGGWMNVFREVMGFLLIGTAVFLAYILQSQLGEHFFPFLIFVVPLTFACWLYGKAAGPGVETGRHVMVLVLVLAITIGSGYFLIKIPKVEHASAGLTGELMRKALVDEKRMVFLDFGANWCATCKVFETTVLYSKDVQDEFKKKNVLLIKGDFTNRDPKINAWLDKFGRAGVPLYVILRPGDTIVADMLPDAITRQMVIDALNK
jgi:thiol:disulfide interchange protein DsbD